MFQFSDILLWLFQNGVVLFVQGTGSLQQKSRALK